MKVSRNASFLHHINGTWFQKVLFFCVGFGVLLWFLIRVIPKPSRATYPCQQAAFPIASAFVIWITGILSSSFLFVRAKATWKRSRYVAAFLLMLLCIGAFLMTMTPLK